MTSGQAASGPDRRRDRPDAAPSTIVSLVPSITESLFALGLGSRVVGVTEWCVHPAAEVAGLPKLGGTKDPDVAAIAALGPDLVIANHEENTRRAVQHLEEAGLRVWVTYPTTVMEGAMLLAELAALHATGHERECARRDVAEPLIERVRAAEQGVRSEVYPAPTRVFCPIWRNPWMTIGEQTYIHDLLRLCGGANVFALHGDRRYPIVDLAEIEAADPEVMLLPSEPYDFGEAERSELLALSTCGSRNSRIHLIDGTLASWYGPRITLAIQTLRPLLANS
jgi:ABC-type Fe3+-hydroxamate transport system substrate-binding protein